MNVFISGGCKNGKSYYAQRQAKNLAEAEGRKLYYIATMIPRDEEDRTRIRRHLSERKGWGFETLEQGIRLRELLKRDEVNKDGVFLLDSVTAIMENEMFPRELKGAAGQEISIDEKAPGRVKADMVAFAETIAGAGGSVVFVSDGIYGDMGGYSRSTEDYRRALAGADRAIASICDKVVEIAYGMEEIWKNNTGTGAE